MTPVPAAPPVRTTAPVVAARPRVAQPKKTREPGSFNISEYLDRSVEGSYTGGAYHCPHCSGSGWADPLKQGWNFVKGVFSKKKSSGTSSKADCDGEKCFFKKTYNKFAKKDGPAPPPQAPPPKAAPPPPKTTAPPVAESYLQKERAHAATKAQILKELNLPPNPTPADVKKAYLKASKKYHPDKGGDKDMFNVLNELKTELTGSGFDRCPHCCGGAPISGGGWGDFTSWLNKTYDDTIGKIPGVGPKLKEIIQQLPPVVAADTLGKSAQHIADGEPGKIVDTVMAAGKKLVNPKSYADILTKGTPLHKLAKRATQYAENAVQVPGLGMSVAAAKGEANDLLADEDEEEEEGGGYAPVSGGGPHRVILPGSVLSRKDFITHYPGFPGPSRENHNGLSDFGTLKRFWEPPYGYTPQARSQWAPVSSFPNQYDGRSLSRVTGDPRDVPDTPSHPYHGAGLTGGVLEAEVRQAYNDWKEAEAEVGQVRYVSSPEHRAAEDRERAARFRYHDLRQQFHAQAAVAAPPPPPPPQTGKRRRDDHGGGPVSGGDYAPVSGGVMHPALVEQYEVLQEAVKRMQALDRRKMMGEEVGGEYEDTVKEIKQLYKEYKALKKDIAQHGGGPVSGGGDEDYDDYSSSEDEDEMEGGGKKRLPRNKSQRKPRYHREVLSHNPKGYGRNGKTMSLDFMHLADPQQQYHRNVIRLGQQELATGVPARHGLQRKPSFLTNHPGLQIYTR